MQFAPAETLAKNCKRVCFCQCSQTNEKEVRPHNIGYKQLGFMCLNEKLKHKSKASAKLKSSGKKSPTAHSREPLGKLKKTRAWEEQKK